MEGDGWEDRRPHLQTVPGGDGERRTSVDGMRGPVRAEGDAPARGQYVRVGGPPQRGICDAGEYPQSPLG